MHWVQLLVWRVENAPEYQSAQAPPAVMLPSMEAPHAVILPSVLSYCTEYHCDDPPRYIDQRPFRKNCLKRN